MGAITVAGGLLPIIASMMAHLCDVAGPRLPVQLMCTRHLGHGLLELEGLGRGPEGLVVVGTDVTDVAVDPLGVVERVDPVGHRDYEFERCRPFLRVE